MNKFLRYSLSVVLAIVANLSLMAAEPYKVLTFPDDNKANNAVNNYATKWEAKMGDDVWTIENFNNNKWNWTYIKCGNKNAESTATITSPFFPEKIKYVVLTIDKVKASLINKLTVRISSDDGTDKPYKTHESSFNPTEIKAGYLTVKVIGEAIANAQVKITAECAKAISNGSLTISKVALYKDGDAPTIVDISNTAETAYTVAKAKELIDAGQGLATEVYVKGIVSKAPTSLNKTYGSLTYSISDDGKAENEFEVYSGLNIDGEKFTSADQVKVGDEVVVFGSLMKYNDKYELDYDNKLISIKSPTTGISNITTSAAAENAPAFNLAGQKVSKAYKGVVIKAGKKFIQK